MCCAGVDADNRDMDKARSTLKQFVRDWSVEGEKERQLSYAPILNALNALYGNLSADEKFFPPTYWLIVELEFMY